MRYRIILPCHTLTLASLQLIPAPLIKCRNFRPPAEHIYWTRWNEGYPLFPVLLSVARKKCNICSVSAQPWLAYLLIPILDPSHPAVTTPLVSWGSHAIQEHTILWAFILWYNIVVFPIPKSSTTTCISRTQPFPIWRKGNFRLKSIISVSREHLLCSEPICGTKRLNRIVERLSCDIFPTWIWTVVQLCSTKP